MLGGTGGAERGAPGPRPGPSTVLSVFLGLRHLGLGLALQSQSLAFSLDSHHGLSVRLAQSQQPWPTDHRGRGGECCRLKSCLDTAQSTMASCIYPQITKVPFSVSPGWITTSDPFSILSSKITEIHSSQRFVLLFHTVERLESRAPTPQLFLCFTFYKR